MGSEFASDPRMNRDFGSFMSTLVWWPVAQILGEVDPSIHSLLGGSDTARFPDGTVRLDTTEVQRELWIRMDEYRQAGLGIRQNTLYRSLDCFPNRRYQLLTTSKYFGSSRFRVGDFDGFRSPSARW